MTHRSLRGRPFAMCAAHVAVSVSNVTWLSSLVPIRRKSIFAVARPGSPHTVKVPCQFCASDIAPPKGKHHKWCPVINPVKSGDKLFNYQAVLLDEKAPISRQCIARVELEYLSKGAPGWLSEVKKT